MELWGKLADGRHVHAITLTGKNGIKARVLTLGATLQSLWIPDHQGHPTDIVLGFDDPQSYLDHRFYIGSTIGRYANRIANGSFVLDGQRFELAQNNGPNCLHGGPNGFDVLIWDIVEHSETRVTLSLTSPHLDGGFPGHMTVLADYQIEENKLYITYRATTDAPTVINMTNHAYFNLSGQSDQSMLDHSLKIYANSYTPLNQHQIPTGEIVPVKNMPMDFQNKKSLGADIEENHPQMQIGSGYDLNYVIQKPAGELAPSATLSNPATKIEMTLWSNKPGLQLYSGNYLPNVKGKNGVPIGPRTGICLEPQDFPDAPNQAAFPSASLNPGETYRHEIILEFEF